MQNSLTFPRQNKFSLTISFIFWYVKKQLSTVINGKFPHTPGFLEGKSLTAIISRLWVYICQADIYINTTQVEPLSHDGSFNLKNNVMTKFPDNSLTWHYKIPWHFPDMGQMGKIPWHFLKIRWLFPDLEAILFFHDISLTCGKLRQWMWVA